MSGLVEVGDAFIHPINGDGVLNKVVGANAEEVHFGCQEMRHHGGAGQFYHATDFDFLIEGNSLGFEFILTFCQQSIGTNDLILVGLGVDELSVGPNQILRIKHALSHLDSNDCQTLLAECLSLQTAEEIDGRCKELARKCYGDFFQ